MNLLDSPVSEAAAASGESRSWSAYQQEIFSAVGRADPLLIQAVAGSGKTTTIIEAMRYAPGSSLFLAFNRSIADELRSRVSQGDVKTLNALGHSVWLRERRGARLEAAKSRLLLKQVSPAALRQWGGVIPRVIGLAKSNAAGLDSGVPLELEAFERLIDSYQLDVLHKDLPDVAALALKVFDLGMQDDSQFDFDDQIYWPLAKGWPLPRYSNVFVDEAQDLSPIQHLLLAKLAEGGARIVAVGDRHQAIYGFRGALSNSMDLLRERFSMTELPLSVTYRCAQRIVSEAQEFCPSIEPAPEAPEGSVIAATEPPELFHVPQMIVCRNNAPLFAEVLKHIRERVPCRVKSNFLEGFASFIQGFKVDGTPELRNKLRAWYDKERLAAEEDGFLGKLAYLEDKFHTADLLASETPNVSALLGLIEQLSNGTTGPLFSTIHKAKGLESQSVYLLRPDLLPSKYAKSDEAKQQEANLEYVAITRAKTHLTYGFIPYAY